MSKKYSVRPSSLLGIENEYPAYCFDEACVFLMSHLDEGKKLQFEQEEQKPKKKHYNSVTDFYSSLGVM